MINTYRFGTVVVLTLLLVAVTAPPVAAQETTHPSFTVALNEDGSAQVALTLTYDLTSDDERNAFETLKNDSKARADIQAQFRDNMQSVAAAAANETGREMAVSKASITLSTTDTEQTGVIELAVTWKGLAAVDGEMLVVTEPFASDFEPDRPFTITAPEGYEVTAASPSPAEQNADSATWQAGTNLDGFEVTVEASSTTETKTSSEPTAGESDEESSGAEVPGFGIGVAILALIGAVILARRR